MDYKNEKYIDKESIYSYENSDIIISVFFAILDLISIVIFSINLIPENKDINTLKQKLIKLFSIDIIIRILYTRRYSTWSIYKELSLNIMTSIQFYLIISFFSLSLYNTKELKLKGSILKYCCCFFLITFSYEKIIDFFLIQNFYSFLIHKIIILIQSFGILYCIYKLFKDLQKNMNIIRVKIVDEYRKKDKIYLLILGSPKSSFILFLFYYALKVIAAFIINPVFIIYISIGLNILKETSKYFIFFVCQAIIWHLNEIRFRNDENETNKSQSEEVEKLKC
jgi:hypothetical protein